MPRPVKKRTGKRKLSAERSLPLDKVNYQLLIVGVVVILVGYFFMLEGSVDGVMPLVVAPVLLVTGYCVIIPFALLYRKKHREETTHAETQKS